MSGVLESSTTEPGPHCSSAATPAATFYCGAIGPYRDLPSGANSNAHGSTHWPDVDCVRSTSRWIVTHGRVPARGVDQNLVVEVDLRGLTSNYVGGLAV